MIYFLPDSNMNKFFNKMAASLISLWIAIISFSSRVMGQENEHRMEPMYWVYYPKESLSPVPMIIAFIKVIQILLVVVIFVIWIINFVRIRKIDDKAQKRKSVKRTVIILLTTLIIILLMSISARLIKKYYA
jgi:uncharacterized membrane protein